MQAELLNYLKGERHMVGREDLVRLFRVVAAEASHQLPTLPPTPSSDPSIRETMPPQDTEAPGVADETLRPGSGQKRGSVLPSPQPDRSDTFPSGLQREPTEVGGTDKSPAHQPGGAADEASKRSTEQVAKAELRFGGAAARPALIKLVDSLEHPTLPALPPTKLIPGGSAGLSPMNEGVVPTALDSSFKRTIVNPPKKGSSLFVALLVLLALGAAFVAWLYLRPTPGLGPVVPPPLPAPQTAAEPDASVNAPDASASPAALAIAEPDAEVADAGPALAVPPPVELGTLEVTTEPSVEVWVGRKNYGPTTAQPMQLRLPVGAATVDLRGPGKLVTHERVVVRKSGVTPLRHVFRKGSLEVHLDPFGVIRVDGKEISHLSLGTVDVYEGPHEVEVYNAGLKKGEKRLVTVPPGTTTQVFFTLPQDR